MRVVVTLIRPDGTTRRRMVDTAASRDTGPWEELLARALAVLPPYRAVPGDRLIRRSRVLPVDALLRPAADRLR
jgi:hypothetical protein